MKLNKRNRLLMASLAAVSLAAYTQTPSAYAADVTGDDGNPLTPLVVDGDTNFNGDVTVSGTTLLNDTLTVQPEIASTSNVTNTLTGAGAIDPAIGAVGPTSTLVGTKLGETTGSQTQSTGGGATIETNGDATLTAATGLQTDVTFSRLTTVEIYNADQVDAGQPVPGSQLYFAAKPDAMNPGQFIAISPTFATEVDLNTWINDPANDPATLFAADNDLGIQAPLANTGGNLLVGGDANVDGTLSVGGIADVEQSINDSVAADALIQADVDANELASDAEDASIRVDFAAADAATLASANTYTDVEVAAEAALRIQGDADTLASANTYTDVEVAAEAALRIQGDADEQAARIAEDASIRVDFAAADTAIIANYEAADASIIAAYTAADTAITNEFRAADASIIANYQAADTAINNRITNEVGRLDGRIDNAERKIAGNRKQIDRNSRGIAMVAAMTNTTIAADKTQALDFNISHFDAETGFAFGYGYRVNENLQINAAGASTFDFDEAVIRAGISYQW